MTSVFGRIKQATGTRPVRFGLLFLAIFATVSFDDRVLFESSISQRGAPGRQLLANARAEDAGPVAPSSAVAVLAQVRVDSANLARGADMSAPPVQLAALENAPNHDGAPAQRVEPALPTPAMRNDGAAGLVLDEEPLTGQALRYAIGDRLQVTVFERVDQSNERPRYLARQDMSGAAVVEADGRLTLPFIGTLAAYDRTPSELAAEIRLRAQALSGSTPRVTLAITSRQPVFVSGDAITARAVDYMPGLLLTQAVTLAGGARAGSDRLWQQIDLAREEERLENAEQNLSRLLARRAVLQAERDAAARAEQGSAEAPQAGVPMRDAGFQIDLERAAHLRSLERAEIAQQKDATEAEIASLDAELAHLRANAGELEEVLAEKMKKTREAEKLLGRGLTTKSSIETLESQLRLIQVRYSEVRATILRTQTQSQQLIHRQRQIELQERAQRERSLAEAEVAIRQAEGTIAALAKLIDQARLRGRSTTDGKGQGGGVLSYLIARRTPDGVEERPADLYTALQPGDVVRVEFGAAMVADAASGGIKGARQ